MTISSSDAKTAPEAKPSASSRTDAPAAQPAAPTLVNKIFGPVKKLLGG